METFAAPKRLVPNPRYSKQKLKSLKALSHADIDVPIQGIIQDFNALPYCFTIQCCYGHFLYKTQRDPHNLDRLPVLRTIAAVEYRIAYVAFCVANSDSGRAFRDSLKTIVDIDPQNIQFCSAKWFWERQVNSYALQVEPDRFKHLDRATLEYGEALKIEKLRDAFFKRLKGVIDGRYDGV
jgi:hypothetical protein